MFRNEFQNSVTRFPHARYLENVLPNICQGIKALEAGVCIIYPQKERYQWKIPRVILEIPYGSHVSIQETISGSTLNVAVNIYDDIPTANHEHSKITPHQLTDIDEDKMFHSVVASGESPDLALLGDQALRLAEDQGKQYLPHLQQHALAVRKHEVADPQGHQVSQLSDEAVRLGDFAQCEQYSPHLQERALDVRKREVSDPQGYHNEVSQGSTISQMNAGQLVGNTEQVSHWFMLSKAEILVLKWLERVISALVKSEESRCILTILAELKIVLIEYTVMIDQILMGCAQPANGKQSFPEKNYVIAINKKLKEIISKLNPRDIEKIFPEIIVVTEEDFLCALLGLNSEVANHLKSMPEEFRQHEPDDYYIKNFIEENIDCTENESECDIEKCFKDSGFTRARAVTLAKRHKKSSLKNHQSLSLWLDRYVDDMFRYIVRLSGDSPRYPFKEMVTDKLVDVEFIRYTEDDDGFPQSSNFKVKALNNPTFEREKKYRDWNKGQRYWYHGTDHASVISILEEGIQTRRGRAMQDFSDDDGFYLSSNFKEAKRWALSRNRPAVIIFKKSEPSQKFKGMNLNNHNQARWAQIVKYNRCGRSRKCLPENDLRTSFHESDFVLGPRSIDGRKGTPENESYLAWQPLGYQEGHQQLCIRSEEMAEIFGEVDNIEGVIFY